MFYLLIIVCFLINSCDNNGTKKNSIYSVIDNVIYGNPLTIEIYDRDKISIKIDADTLHKYNEGNTLLFGGVYADLYNDLGGDINSAIKRGDWLQTKDIIFKGKDLIIKEIQEKHDDVWIVTQNIDGIHQRADNKNIIELHGSLWRLRCENESKIFYDMDKGEYRSKKCACGSWLRPDIIWFNDMLDLEIIGRSNDLISCCDLFISIGTSGVVWPAAGYPQLARSSGGAVCIEINPDPSLQSHMYDHTYQENAGEALLKLLKSD